MSVDHRGEFIQMRVSHWLAAFLILWLLVGPRVDILDAAGSSVRAEDVILLVFAVIGVVTYQGSRRTLQRVRGIGLVTTIAVLAAAAGALFGTVSAGAAALYAIRPLEYWFVLPMTVWLIRSGGEEGRKVLLRILAVTTVVHATVAAAQYLFDLNIGFSAFSLERGAGLTNGPYELGAIMSMLVCVWVHQRRAVLAVLAFAALMMSLSRISILGAVVGLVLLGVAVISTSRPGTRTRLRPAPGAVVVTTLLVIVAVLAAPMVSERLVAPAFERARGTSLADTWQAAGSAAQVTPQARNSDEYAAIAYGAIGTSILDGVSTSDASNEVRFYRWHLLLQELRAGPERWFIGLGPSFAGPSVDGAYLRILVETGLVGLVAWILMIARWFRVRAIGARGAVAALLVGNVFIDLFYAERPMVAFWVIIGIAALTRIEPSSSNPEEPVSRVQQVR